LWRSPYERWTADHRPVARKWPQGGWDERLDRGTGLSSTCGFPLGLRRQGPGSSSVPHLFTGRTFARSLRLNKPWPPPYCARSSLKPCPVGSPDMPEIPIAASGRPVAVDSRAHLRSLVLCGACWRRGILTVGAVGRGENVAFASRSSGLSSLPGGRQRNPRRLGPPKACGECLSGIDHLAREMPSSRVAVAESGSAAVDGFESQPRSPLPPSAPTTLGVTYSAEALPSGCSHHQNIHVNAG